MRDEETIDEFIKNVLDRYTAEELVEALGLSTRDVIDAFYDAIIERGYELLEQD